MGHGAGKDGEALSSRRTARGAHPGGPQALGRKGFTRLHPARMRTPGRRLPRRPRPPLRLDRRPAGRYRHPRLSRPHTGDGRGGAAIERRCRRPPGRPGRRLHGLRGRQSGALPAHVQPRGQSFRDAGAGRRRQIRLPPASRGGRGGDPAGFGRGEGAHGRFRLGRRARLHHARSRRPARRARTRRARSRRADWRPCRRWWKPSCGPAAAAKAGCGTAGPPCRRRRAPCGNASRARRHWP